MDSRPLGDSGLTVSRLSLGSWRTFERVSRDEGLAVMRAAREAGITFLDDARYDDETGTAPIRTGYSEVVFGDLFRAAGWPRDQTVVSNKLWWEHWPEESAAKELEGSLGRMGLEHVDVIYANAPINGLGLEELVSSVGGLVTSGLARAWAIVNWPADQLLAASAIAAAQGVPQPCAAQLPYNVAHRDEVEGPEMRAALAACGAPVVASYVLFGGVLTGKYDDDPAAGRAAGSLDDPRVAHGMVVGRRLAALARSAGVTPAQLAFAFALAPSSVASVLFGATRPEQVWENVAALDLVDRLDEPTWRELRWIGAGLD
jgi:aryl-alcohol dehydrogenase-like predicted oxidoreductase